MLWTSCHDDGRQIHYEVRHAMDEAGFELVVHYPDGRQGCERFGNAAALNRRALEIQQELLDDGWFVGGTPRR